jgi:uncharacterized protein YcgL (UPF0745 family)
MKADVYRTDKKDTYLFLPQGNPFSSLPQSVLNQLGALQFFKTVELVTVMFAANPDVIKADFLEQGYSIRVAELKFTIMG